MIALTALLCCLQSALGAPLLYRQWHVFDRGISVAAVDTNTGAGCQIAGVETARTHSRFPIREDSAVSPYVSPIGGSARYYYRRTRSVPVIVAETLFAEQLTMAFPSLSTVGPPASLGGWVDLVHPGAVWQLRDPYLIAPGLFLSDLSECSFDELRIRVLSKALHSLPLSPRRAAVAVLNDWHILDGLSRHPDASWGVVPPLHSRALPGEIDCLGRGACKKYVEAWLNSVK